MPIWPYDLIGDVRHCPLPASTAVGTEGWFRLFAKRIGSRRTFPAVNVTAFPWSDTLSDVGWTPVTFMERFWCRPTGGLLNQAAHVTNSSGQICDALEGLAMFCSVLCSSSPSNLTDLMVCFRWRGRSQQRVICRLYKECSIPSDLMQVDLSFFSTDEYSSQL